MVRRRLDEGFASEPRALRRAISDTTLIRDSSSSARTAKAVFSNDSSNINTTDRTLCEANLRVPRRQGVTRSDSKESVLRRLAWRQG